jgi:predicted DNA-binding transcriptional regulator AlpA
MTKKILRRKEICAILNISTTTFWRLRRANKFPAPKHILGTTIQVWSEAIVDRWITENFSDDEL